MSLTIMFWLASSVAFALLAPAIAQTCDPQKESCDAAAATLSAESADEMTSEMRISMLQRKAIEPHDHAASEGDKVETMSELEERKKALLVELDNVDSELASMNATEAWGEQMVPDPLHNNKKCGNPGDFSRTFELKVGATEQSCKQKCLDDPYCKYMSGQFHGTTWCFGCSTELYTDSYPAQATAFRKQGGGPSGRLVKFEGKSYETDNIATFFPCNSERDVMEKWNSHPEAPAMTWFRETKYCYARANKNNLVPFAYGAVSWTRERR